MGKITRSTRADGLVQHVDSRSVVPGPRPARASGRRPQAGKWRRPAVPRRRLGRVGPSRHTGAMITEPNDLIRCFGNGDPLYEQYHDAEWGVPVHGDAALYERIVLEGVQSGLSWLTILRKRDNYPRGLRGLRPRRRRGVWGRRRGAASRRCRHRPQSPQDQRLRSPTRAPWWRCRRPAARSRSCSGPSPPRRGPARAKAWSGRARVDPRIGGAREGPQEGRLRVRWPHHDVRGNAGVRAGGRPPRRVRGGSLTGSASNNTSACGAPTRRQAARRRCARRPGAR